MMKATHRPRMIAIFGDILIEKVPQYLRDYKISAEDDSDQN